MENELNCAKYDLMEVSIDQLTNFYFQPNWDTHTTISNDQNDPFESSALSSIVSSPIASSNGGGDGMMIRELIGRLGSICGDSSGGEITLSPTIINNYNNYNNNSTNTSCYSTPLNSPPSKFNLSSLMLMGNNNNVNNNNNCGNYPIQQNIGSFNCDPGFVERAAKFSCYGGGNASNLGEIGGANSTNNGVVIRSNGRLSRVNFEKKLGGENGDSREGSSLSEQNPAVKLQNETNSRKRKSISKPKVKDSLPPTTHDKVDVKNEEINTKRSKLEEKEAKNENTEENTEECDNNNNKEKNDNNNQSNNKEASKPEPPKDYIHVRARRGQATDSHSLAERVRREKISERMKFLQDLVPGCNKVTGKATILDEIINYVQSLQRQVEFLSMKLATVNPRMEFNMEALLSKDMLQSRGSLVPQTMYPIDQNSVPFAYQSTQQMSLPLPNGGSNGIVNHLSANPLDGAGIRRHPAIPLNGFIDTMIQLPTLWEDDLQSIVQMGIVQSQTQNVSAAGTIPNAQMKVEL